MEIFLISRGVVWKFVECGIIMDKDRGFFAKLCGFSWFWIIFEWKKRMDSVHRMVDRVGPWSTVDPRTQARRQLAKAMLAG
jgi:hypothetical protein